MIEKFSAFLSMPAAGSLSEVRELVEDVCRDLAIELSCVDGGTFSTGSWDQEAKRLIDRAELVISIVAQKRPDERRLSKNVEQELCWARERRKDVIILLQEGLTLGTLASAEKVGGEKAEIPPHISFSIQHVSQIQKLVFSRLFEWREARMRCRYGTSAFLQQQFEMCMALDANQDSWTHTLSRELIFNYTPREPLIFGFENNVPGETNDSVADLVEDWELTTSGCMIVLEKEEERHRSNNEVKGAVRFARTKGGSLPSKGERARFTVRWNSKRANPISPVDVTSRYVVDNSQYDCFDGIFLVHPTKTLRVSVVFPNGYYPAPPKLLNQCTYVSSRGSGQDEHDIRIVVLDDVGLSALAKAGNPKKTLTRLASAEERRVVTFTTRQHSNTKFTLEVSDPILRCVYGFAWRIPDTKPRKKPARIKRSRAPRVNLESTRQSAPDRVRKGSPAGRTTQPRRGRSV